MIDRTHVKRVAKKVLGAILRDHQTILKQITENKRFDAWLDRAHPKVVEMESFLTIQGLKNEALAYAMNDFIGKAAIYYANTILDNSSEGIRIQSDMSDAKDIKINLKPEGDNFRNAVRTKDL